MYSPLVSRVKGRKYLNILNPKFIRYCKPTVVTHYQPFTSINTTASLIISECIFTFNFTRVLIGKPHVVRTFRSFCKLGDPVPPGLPGFSEGFCSVHLLHGLPHLRAPLGDVPDRCVDAHCTKIWMTKPGTVHTVLGLHWQITIVELQVLLGNKGIGSPYNHLADDVGVLRRRDHSGDSSVAPPQQRELDKSQRLAIKWAVVYVPNRVRVSFVLLIQLGE